MFTKDTTVGEVIHYFDDYGRLLFPVHRHVNDNMTLEEVSSSSVYIWYSNIQSAKTVEILNTLKNNKECGKTVFYDIYSEEEKKKDPDKRNTGLFYFHGKEDQPFAVVNAGGGFMYVGAMHDSFPHALELSKMGYNAFALIYRPDDAYEDLARAITFIEDHADELHVQRENYSLWGGSAGARMAAVLGNQQYFRYYTQRTDLPYASAVIMQYTGYSDVSKYDAPTYVCVGTSDYIADDRGMERRLKRLDSIGIPTEFHRYRGLSHGFGLGTGTIADGWIYDAVKFWKKNSKKYR